MEKILVVTDLSVRSVPAIHFAYKFSQITGASLVILHVYYLFRPKGWRSQRFENYHEVRKEFMLRKLNRLFEHISCMNETPAVNLEIDLQMNQNMVSTVLKCAKKHNCTYMCTSTYGASEFKQIISTDACRLILKAPIPIFSVPSVYKIKSIYNICYASDMINYLKEIKKVIELVKNTSITIDMLHVTSALDTLPRRKVLESRLLKRTSIAINVKYVLKTTTNTLIEDLDFFIKKIKPSLVVFFIKRSKQDLESILYALHKQSLTTYSKFPVLTYKK